MMCSLWLGPTDMLWPMKYVETAANGHLTLNRTSVGHSYRVS
jgi:hypothetical protein